MIENFNIEEINKFIIALDEHCVNGSRADCEECPFSIIPCSAIKGNKFRNFAKLLHDWVDDKNTKPLTKVQITYLKSLKTLGLEFLARDWGGTVSAYYTYPRRIGTDEGYWDSVDPSLDLSYMGKRSLTIATALDGLCDWKDEEPLNITKSLVAEKVVLGK